MIDGSWVRHATHWAIMPAPTMSASVGPIADSPAARMTAFMRQASAIRGKGSRRVGYASTA